VHVVYYPSGPTPVSGYSVFVVSQIDPFAPIALPRTEADELATVTPEITGTSTRMSTSRSLNATTSKSAMSEWTTGAEALENEDVELQRALLASVGGAEVAPVPSSSTKPIKRESLSEEWDIGHARSLLGDSPLRGKAREVAADAHDRRMEQIARFKDEQERAMNDPTDSDDIIANILSKKQGVPSISEPLVPQKRPRQRRDDEEEEEMMRRAIAASQKESQKEEDDKDDEDDEPSYDFDDDHHFYDEEEERLELERLFQERTRLKKEQDAREKLRASLSSSSPPPLSTTDSFDPFMPGMLGANAAHLDNRMYDDEDAELQAALKASLEDAPGGVTIPSPPKATRAATRAESPRASTSTSKPGTSAVTSVKGKATQEDEDSEEETDDEEMEQEPEEKPKPLTAEEMRKARLARFGG
jgi:ataxin-3